MDNQDRRIRNGLQCRIEEMGTGVDEMGREKEADTLNGFIFFGKVDSPWFLD
jgi:hypothetical protein